MANKHDLEAVIREMLPDITKAVKKGVAEQLNARPTRDKIQTLVSQAVAADLKTVIGPPAAYYADRDRPAANCRT